MNDKGNSSSNKPTTQRAACSALSQSSVHDIGEFYSQFS